MKLPTRCVAVLPLLLGMLSLPAHANDLEAGQKKAQSCATCHGSNGISQMPNAPHLAGQPAIYLEEQLKAYRSGKRQHEIMSVIAKPLTDTDIKQLAAWYSSMQIEVVPR